jgi:hypothetical protein
MEGVGSRFHILCFRTRFWRYRGRRVPFSYFALPNSFSTVPRALGPVFMFCAPELVFGGAECVRSCFHVLHSLTHFWQYRVRRVPFSCFAHPDSFSAIPRASGPVFKFCAPGLIFDSTEGVGSHFNVLRTRTGFRRYKGRPIPFSCFPLPDLFLAVRTASGSVFMFCKPGLVFGSTKAVESRFHVLRARTYFRRYRGCRVPFSCFACRD